MVVVVALSGSVSSGKSTLAEALKSTWGGTIISTSEAIAACAKQRGHELRSRADFQAYGDRLDREEQWNWVAEAAGESPEPDGPLLIIDAVRRHEQISKLRERFGRSVAHVHLTADSLEELATRYRQRSATGRSFEEFDSYDEVVANETEAQVHTLGRLADVILDTSRSTKADLLARCAARLGLLTPTTAPLVDVIVGGQYGSEGKGNVAFHLAPEYSHLVRVGGPNAGHKVRHQGKEYTHRSLPSGALANPQAKLLIGPGAVVSFDVLQEELEATKIDPSRVCIDPQAMVISPEDLQQEAALKAAIQSTGQGAGSAAARRILERAEPKSSLAKDVASFKPFLSPIGEHLSAAFEAGERVLLEGTQGTGLSLYHGEYPYVTSRDTTVAGTLAEAGIGPRRVRRVVMVVRTYPIRVNGDSGPIGKGSELAWSEIELRSGLSGLARSELSSVTKKKRRVAEFDWALLRRSAELNSATDIALTFADYIDVKNREAYRYEQLTPETLQFVEEVESVSGASASLIVTNFFDRSIIDRRTWRSGGPLGVAAK